MPISKAASFRNGLGIYLLHVIILLAHYFILLLLNRQKTNNDYGI